MKPVSLLALVGGIAAVYARDPNQRLPRHIDSPVCVGASAEFAIIAHSQYVHIVSDTDSVATAQRMRWGIPIMTPDSVSVLQDSVSCATGGAAYARYFPSQNADTLVILRLGPLRAVTPQPIGFGRQSGPAVLDGVFSSDFATLVDTVKY